MSKDWEFVLCGIGDLFLFLLAAIELEGQQQEIFLLHVSNERFNKQQYKVTDKRQDMKTTENTIRHIL